MTPSKAAWDAQEATLRALIADLEVRGQAAELKATRVALEAQERQQRRALAWLLRCRS